MPAETTSTQDLHDRLQAGWDRRVNRGLYLPREILPKKLGDCRAVLALAGIADHRLAEYPLGFTVPACLLDTATRSYFGSGNRYLDIPAGALRLRAWRDRSALLLRHRTAGGEELVEILPWPLIIPEFFWRRDDAIVPAPFDILTPANGRDPALIRFKDRTGKTFGEICRLSVHELDKDPDDPRVRLGLTRLRESILAAGALFDLLDQPMLRLDGECFQGVPLTCEQACRAGHPDLAGRINIWPDFLPHNPVTPEDLAGFGRRCDLLSAWLIDCLESHGPAGPESLTCRLSFADTLSRSYALNDTGHIGRSPNRSVDLRKLQTARGRTVIDILDIPPVLRKAFSLRLPKRQGGSAIATAILQPPAVIQGPLTAHQRIAARRLFGPPVSLT